MKVQIYAIVLKLYDELRKLQSCSKEADISAAHAVCLSVGNCWVMSKC